MYGKLFETMYDGTLVENWKALVTFQQLIILADQHGIVDMTIKAISRRTGIPIEIIKEGIKYLENTDNESRTPTEEGRRIISLSDHRKWGWKIVNYKYYRDLKTQEERREYMRNYMRDYRKSPNSTDDNSDLPDLTVKNCKQSVNNCKQQLTDLTHTDTDTYTDINNRYYVAQARQVLNFLNKKTGRNYQPVRANLDMIVARLKEAPLKKIRALIAVKCREWANDEKMNKFLRPKTLFNRTNFANYLGELPHLNEEAENEDLPGV